jgi:sulfhydrogenase subunit beta (sulfur reductase)
MQTEPVFLSRDHLQVLLDALSAQGYRCVGPQLRDNAVVFDDLKNIEQLPRGWREVQAPGSYRLQHADDQRLFAWANGPQTLKPFLFAPAEPLWRARRTERGFVVEGIVPTAAPLAVIGVRGCDLAALRLQDQVFLDGPYVDPYYATRRDRLFLVAINCTHPAATCFCVSTGDGPTAEHGFDISLTELEDGFVATAATTPGLEILGKINAGAATSRHLEEAREALETAAASQTRGLPGRNLKEALFANLNHGRWDEVASRCLSCANCTSVCPTCFCHGESDQPTLDGSSTVHERQWDSCFSEGHGHIHGMQVRPQIRHRYRQWLTHKLGSWHDQFGRSGCVGCGRCITWCPVGIDLTEEAHAICAG